MQMTSKRSMTNVTTILLKKGKEQIGYDGGAKNVAKGDVYASSAGASGASSFESAGLSAESCISEVQRVKLSLNSCMMRVESL
jgi:hypothetical protein